MPEYLEVETYHLCPDPRNTNLFDRFGLVLECLGYPDQTAVEIGKHLLANAQNPPNEYYGNELLRFAIPGFTVRGKPVYAAPSVLYYSDYENTHVPTMSLGLAFETQTDEQDLENIDSFAPDWGEKHNYLPGVGRLIWHVLVEFAAIFPEVPICFVHGAQWGETWNALMTGEGDVWKFQVAIIPRRFAAAFTAMPDTFARFDSLDALAFAERARWLILPWDE